MQHDTITALLQAVANVNAALEARDALIRDYWQLQVAWDTGSTQTDEEYRALHNSVLVRTRALLGEM